MTTLSSMAHNSHNIIVFLINWRKKLVNSIQLFVCDLPSTISTEIFLQDFLVILKRMLQYNQKILKKYFLGIYYIHSYTYSRSKYLYRIMVVGRVGRVKDKLLLYVKRLSIKRLYVNMCAIYEGFLCTS